MKKSNKNSYDFCTGFSTYTLNFNKEVNVKSIKYVDDLVNNKANNIIDIIQELFELKNSGVYSLNFFKESLADFKVSLSRIYAIIMNNFQNFEGVKFCIENDIDYLNLNKEFYKTDIFRLFSYIDFEYYRLCPEFLFIESQNANELIELFNERIEQLKQPYNCLDKLGISCMDYSIEVL